MHILARIDTALDSAKFVPWAAGFATALGAELTLLRDKDRAQVDPDMLLCVHSRICAWMHPFLENPVRRILRESQVPVCIVSSKCATFRPRRILCELRLDGRDGPVLDTACDLADHTGLELVLMIAVPPPGEDLIVRAVEGPIGPPLSLSEALARLPEIGRPYCAELAVGTSRQLLRGAIGGPGSALVVTRAPSALSTLRIAMDCPVLAVSAASRLLLPHAINVRNRDRQGAPGRVTQSTWYSKPGSEE